jgi:hypothetical protein
MKLITFSIVLLATSIAPAQNAQPAAPTAKSTAVTDS